MASNIDKKDLIGGLALAAVGIAATAIGSTYPLGTVQRMGPGFFPVSLGILLLVLGLGIAAGSRASGKAQNEAAPQLPSLRALLGISAAMIAFIIVAKYFGFVPASLLLVAGSALVDRGNSWMTAAALAVAICVFSFLLFVYVLQVPLPLFW